MHYDPQSLEPKWQKFWKENKTFEVREEEAGQKQKSYILDMFPYPSGAGLHVGHPLGYAATDVVSRYERMQGKTVLHTMGWDAFGLPAEQYALKTGVHPEITTKENVGNFKRQIQSLGFSYDWSREVNTTDPEYYKQTQWIFLQLYKSYYDPVSQRARPIGELRQQLAKNGELEGKTEKEVNEHLNEYRLAYEAEMPVNWCAELGTVLANEEVIDGKSERGGYPVERIKLRQWVMRITAYADRLIDELGAPRVYMLHGHGGTRDDHFWPKLREHCEKLGYEVWALEVPNSESQEYEEWKKCMEDVPVPRPQDICVGTSLGGSFWLRYIREEQLAIARLITIATTGPEDAPERYGAWNEWNKASLQDSQAVRSLARERVMIWSKDDLHDTSSMQDLAMGMEAQIMEYEGWGHFCTPDLPSEVYELFSESAKDILDWPRSIIAQQENWIGRSEGAHIRFGTDSGEIEVYTTRPDTLYGATFMVLSPEHPLVEYYTTQEQEGAVKAYQKKASQKSDRERGELNKEKTGVWTGGYARHPLTGKDLPVWIGDYVLMGYGTGAVMAVPGHDERDHEFALQYRLPVVSVITGIKDPYEKSEEGILQNSGECDGMSVKEGTRVILAKLESTGRGESSKGYKLRDWIFSRQRYWGEPIPILHSPTRGHIPVREEDLPVLLPEVESYQPTGKAESPLAGVRDWVETTDPETGEKVLRETNTMPQWAGSCWYYLRYMDPQNPDAPVSEEREKTWGNVDMYVGGAEHAVLHLLYARFWHKVLYDLGYVSTSEPFRALRNQGMILGEDGAKMSKSVGNVINPDEIVQEYGADTLRVYEMFMGPFEASKAWDTGAVIGIFRFLRRSSELLEKPRTERELTAEEGSVIHQMLKKVGEDIPSFKFNTAVSALMVALNAMSQWEQVPQNALEIYTQCLSPLAPHLGEEMWESLGHSGGISHVPWPAVEERYLVQESVEIAVQVMGKLRGAVTVSAEATEEEVLAAARAHPNVQKHLKGKTERKVICVPGKMVSFVVG